MEPGAIGCAFTLSMCRSSSRPGLTDDVGADRVGSAEETPAGRLRALEPQVQVRLGLDLERAVEPAAAAETAGAAGVRAEPVAADQRRVLHLEDLDRVVLEAAVDVVDQTVLAVAALEAAPAAGVRHHVQERLAATARVVPREEQHHRVAEVRRRHLVGQDRRERRYDEVDQQPEGA